MVQLLCAVRARTFLHQLDRGPRTEPGDGLHGTGLPGPCRLRGDRGLHDGAARPAVWLIVLAGAANRRPRRSRCWLPDRAAVAALEPALPRYGDVYLRPGG